MMIDIFSSFDPHTNYIITYKPYLFWAQSFRALIVVHSTFWLSPSPILWSVSYPLQIITQQVNRTTGTHIKGFSSFITALFSIIIIINFIGLLPYTFRFSSHLVFTLAYGAPLWMSLILSSLTNNPKSFAAKLLPGGAPDWLNPFLVLIETIRILVRPITLSVRLAANIRAGHIVLGLIGIYTASAIFLSIFHILTLLSVQILYLLFELGICLIQAYIFCLLLTLYADDHS